MSIIPYENFLKQKLIRRTPSGLKNPDVQNDMLFEWQKSVVNWGLKRGCCAFFEDCGLGKTPQQLAWADEIQKAEGGNVLILAPLAVSQQTVREGRKFGYEVNIAESQSDIKTGINITNYEKLDKFDTSKFTAVVLDESSILKSYMGKTKRAIINAFSETPYKLACSATPAPNDLMELLNHAEFLGIMRSSEALSVWFIADQSQSGKYRLKGHAEKDFWEWVSSWAVCIEKPSDIGYSDEGYMLPELHEENIIIPIDEFDEYGNFRKIDMSATGFYREKSKTAKQRAVKCAELASTIPGQCVIWCDTNEEADLLKTYIPEAVEIRGSDKAERKESAAINFINGNTKILISKPSIFGYGLNFQNCSDSIFCGLDYSFESYYQAVRRFYRFGQEKEVNIYRVLGSTEMNILSVLDTKAKTKRDMNISMSEAMRTAQTANVQGHHFKLDLKTEAITIPNFLRSEA